MTPISNGYFVGNIITANERDDNIDACFEVFQLKRDDTKSTIKKACGNVCSRFHSDNNGYTCASQVMKTMNPAKR